MQSSKLKVVTEGWEVKSTLQTLGLTPEIICNVARAAAGAKADSLAVDPCSTPGQLAYIYGVRNIRLQLLPKGWRISREGNVESTVNHDLGIQLCFQNVYLACGDRDPEAISGKGSGSRKLIHNGQVELFETLGSTAKKAVGSTPTVWVLCVSCDEKSIRAEVSCPESFEGEQFQGFSKRIFVLDETLDPKPQTDKSSDEDVDDTDFEVRISKK
jgi:hypothetical protein